MLLDSGRRLVTPHRPVMTDRELTAKDRQHRVAWVAHHIDDAEPEGHLGLRDPLMLEREPTRSPLHVDTLRGKVLEQRRRTRPAERRHLHRVLDPVETFAVAERKLRRDARQVGFVLHQLVPRTIVPSPRRHTNSPTCIESRTASHSLT